MERRNIDCEKAEESLLFPDVDEALENTLKDARAEYAEVLAMPRPRAVRLNKLARILLVGMAIIECAWLGMSLAELARKWDSYPSFEEMLRNEYLPIATVLIAVLIAIQIAWGVMAERRVVTRGEIALGRVTGWFRGIKGLIFEYSFEDAAGKTHARQSIPSGGTLQEGMELIVFYDSADPERSVPMRGMWFELKRS